MVSAALTAAIRKAAASGEGAVKNALDKDYGSAAANAAATLPTLVFAAAAEAKSDGFFNSLGDFMKAKPVAYLENAIATIAVLDFLNGLSSPDKGLSLTDGGAGLAFDSAIKSLRLATPNESKWSGPAATAYRDVVKKLQQALAQVKNADAKIQKNVEKQAEMIITLRGQFAYTKIGLMVAMAPALVIYAETYAGRLTFYLAEGIPGAPALAQKDALAATRKFQIGVIGVAMASIAGFVAIHSDAVASNASAAKVFAVSNYDNAAGSLPSLSKSTLTPKDPAPSTSGNPKVSSFQRLSGGNGTSSSTTSYPGAGGRGTSSGATSYPVAGGRGTSSGAGSYPVAGGTGTAAGAGAASTPATPLTPPATAGTFTTAGTGQAGQGTKPPLAGAPTASAPKRAGVAGEQVTGEGATLGAHVEGAGAAEGAERAERAPIEVPAASPEHAQRPASPTSGL